MRAIFQKKGKMFENLGKCTKSENILKKGRRLRVIIAHNKLPDRPWLALCNEPAGNLFLTVVVSICPNF